MNKNNSKATSFITCLICLCVFATTSSCNKPRPKKKKQDSQDLVVPTSASQNIPGKAINISDSLYFAYQWTWSDYLGNIYTDTIKVSREEVRKAGEQRLKITAISPTFPMPNYATIANAHVDFAQSLASKLKSTAKQRSLSADQALDMAVCMVQNIPYTLVHNGSHSLIEEIEIKSGGSFIKQYHSDPTNTPMERELFGGCESHVEPCGVYAPAEFASRLRGDCDTRTVFLFVVLKGMGFDVAVVNGPGHSMLATTQVPVNPAAPFIIHHGMKYYFWETTVFYNQPGLGTGPRNGDTPRDFNASQWNVVLI
jgi:hypothetical protein